MSAPFSPVLVSIYMEAFQEHALELLVLKSNLAS